MSELNIPSSPVLPLQEWNTAPVSKDDSPAYNKPVETAKRDEHAADPEVASIYYLTTLQSLKDVTQPTFKQTKQAVDINEKKKAEKGIIQNIKDWLWGLLGFAKNTTQEEGIEPSQDSESIEPLKNHPILLPPDQIDHDLLNKSILEINYHLEKLKDCHQFEEEMRKSNSKNLDKLLLLQVRSKALLQRDLKQANNLIAFQELHRHRKENEEIQQKTSSISKDLAQGENIAHYLKWINITLSGGLVMGTAAAFFTGGASAIISVALPLSYLLKGVAGISDGVVKFKNEKKQGELMYFKEKVKTNVDEIQYELKDVVQVNNDEIASILKSLRKLLKDQSETERLLARFGK